MASVSGKTTGLVSYRWTFSNSEFDGMDAESGAIIGVIITGTTEKVSVSSGA
jgi:hypothetical protein